MKQFNKIVGVLVIFVIGLLLVDVLVGEILAIVRNKLPNDGERVAKSEFILNKMAADVIVIGSSKAQCNYDCGIMSRYYPNQSIYNCGIDGQKYFYTTLSLLYMLDRYTPKVIIWEIADFAPDKHEDLSLLYPYYSDNKTIKSVIDYNHPSLRYMIWLNAYKYNGTAARLLRALFAKDPGTNGYNALPKHNVSKSCKTRRILVDTKSSDKHPNIDRVKVDLFITIVEAAKKRRIRLYVVNSPVLNASCDPFTKDICDKYDVPFFDYSNNAVFIQNNEYWYDTVHLNSKGASLFTELLMNQIKNV